MAVSRPICSGVAFSSTAAVSGSASIITWLPKLAVRMEPNRRAYEGSRSRSPGGSRGRNEDNVADASESAGF
jgi:hypothetical protein